MAAICTSVHSFSPSLISKSPPPPSLVVVTTRLSSSSSSSSSRSSVSRFLTKSPARRMRAASAARLVCMAPDEEKLTRRNPLDFPVEWERPRPGRRPDIFPQFSPMKTPLPPPLPYDPPAEDEEEEDEENKEEEEDDPDKEQPENRFRAQS
ncbi:splicing factor, arginine/serine-rich 19 [Cynara cardunculus var. scolymus]|uniref:Uncharacterized protein n=1 Tax=Cynara cardunculus var. scolymus TaxID=59895 RepID=A0A103Y2D3_CYNCS|nr:splicing factor, arginine/serine-rich 19 [Cynara cardunculus var. scolymus]KVI01252.1 hypothetical protein Ccrd_020465 [Cynara cardunculus var. scolymus]